MALPILPLVMLLASAAKTEGDLQRRKEDQQVQATTTRYSPWTKMQAPAPNHVDPVGNALSGVAAGMMMQQSLNAPNGLPTGTTPKSPIDSAGGTSPLSNNYAGIDDSMWKKITSQYGADDDNGGLAQLMSAYGYGKR